jgi:hypothetical protein
MSPTLLHRAARKLRIALRSAPKRHDREPHPHPPAGHGVGLPPKIASCRPAAMHVASCSRRTMWKRVSARAATNDGHVMDLCWATLSGLSCFPFINFQEILVSNNNTNVGTILHDLIFQFSVPYYFNSCSDAIIQHLQRSMHTIEEVT